MAELSLERGAIALETTRGTAIAAPTHLLAGSEGGGLELVPTRTNYIRRRGGTLAAALGHTETANGATWSYTEELDPNMLPLFANMAIQGGVTSPTTPGGATNARLWTFLRSMTSNTLRSATLWWGDPTVETVAGNTTYRVLRAAYAMATEMTISGEGEGVATVSLSGEAQRPAPIVPPTYPADIAGPLFPIKNMQVFLNVAGASAVDLGGTVTSVSITIPTGVAFKHRSGGPGSSLGFNAVGIGPAQPTASLTIDYPDWQPYMLFENNSTVALVVVFNAGLIETGQRYSVIVTMEGAINFDSWGDLAGTNRTASFTVAGQYISSLATDLRLQVYNARTTL